MAKAKTFVDKLAKGKQDFTKHCPVCGESLNTVKMIVSERSEKTDTWRFNQKFVGICKCNQGELIK